MRIFYLAFLLLLCLTTFNLNAQWSSDPTLNTAICISTNHQQYPQIISDGSGGAIITWQDLRGGSTYDIYAQKINSSGVVQWTSNGVAICTASSNQQNPQIVSDGSDGAIITWQDSRSGNSDIYAQKINSNGIAQWTSNGVVVCNSSGDQNVPVLLSDGSGGAIFVWEDYRSGLDLYCQRVNSNGVVQWTSNGVAICTAVDSQFGPRLISDGSSGALITWSDRRGGGTDDVYIQRINSSGVVQWASDGVVISATTNTQTSPDIISDGSGGAILAWEDRRSGNSDIYTQRINSSGVVQWTTNGLIVCTATNDQFYSQIISDGSTGAIITWQDMRGGVTSDIYAQKINSSGAVQWTANGVVVCSASNEQYQPRIISDGSTGAILTWIDLRGGSTYDIYSQKINTSGVAQWTANGVAISTASNQQLVPRLISNGSAGAIIIWQDLRNSSDYDIYTQKVNSNGTLNTLPTVTTTSVSSITNTTASSGGNVTSDGGDAATIRGVIYGTSSSPELSASSSTTSDGTGSGSFASSLTSLTLQTLYYVKAYATNNVGTSYGSQVSFTTIPTMPVWGLIAMGMMIASIGGFYVWKKVV